jgi:hypothetical protein
MKNVYDVLRQKEADRARVQAEIDALRLVAPLLDEEERGGQEAQQQEEPASEVSSDASAKAAGGASWRDKWRMASG